MNCLARTTCIRFLLCMVGLVLPQHVGGQENPSEVVLRGHLGPVLMGIFTPDGERAITVSSDETIRFWNAVTGQPLQQLKGHTGPLYAVAISGDGRALVTAAQDNTLRLWDVPQTRPVLWVEDAPLAPGPLAPGPLARSVDGRWLVTGTAENGVRLWDAARLQTVDPQAVKRDEVSELRVGHAAPPVNAAFRADGFLFATADKAGRIRVWSPILKAPQGELEFHPADVRGLVFHPNNQQLVSAGSNGTVAVWQVPPPAPKQWTNLAAAWVDAALVGTQPQAFLAAADGSLRLVDTNQGTVIREFPRAELPLTAVAAAVNGTLVAAVDQAGTTRLYNPADAAPRGVLTGHTGAVNDLVFHADNQTLFTAGADGTVRSWKVPVAAPATLSGHAQPPRVVARAQKGTWLVTAGEDRSVRMWQPNGQPLRTLGPHAQPVTALVVRADDGQVASGDQEGAVWIWDAASGMGVGPLWAHSSAVTALQLTADNQGLLTAGADGTLKRWKLPALPARLSNGHAQAVRDAAMTSDGQRAITLAADNSLRLWRTNDGAEQRRFDGTTGFDAALTSQPNGQLVATGGPNGVLLVWNLVEGNLQSRPWRATGGVLDLALLPQTNRLLTLDADRKLRVRQLPENATAELDEMMAIVQEVAVPDAGSSTLAVSPDGKWVLISGAEKQVRVWAVADGKLTTDPPARTLSGPEGRVTRLAISRDGRRVGAASEDKRVYLWDLAAIAAAGNGQGVAATQRLEHPAAVRGLDFSADGEWLASGGDDRFLSLWHIPSSQLAERFLGHAQALHTVAFVGNERTILAAGDDRTVRTWTPAILSVETPTRENNANPPKPLVALVAHPGDGGFSAITAGGDRIWRWAPDGSPRPHLAAPVAGLQLLQASPDGTQMTAVNGEGKAFVWQVADGQLKANLDFGGPITSLDYRPDGQQLVVADGQARLRIFSREPFRLLEHISLPQPARLAAWHGPEGTQLAALSDQPTITTVQRALIRVWDGVEGGALAVAISPDGARLMAGGADGKVRQWRINDGMLERMLEGHTGAIHDLAVLANGQQLISVAADQTIRQWNLADGALVRMTPNGAMVRHVSSSADNLRLTTSSDDGKVRVWEVATGQLLEQFSGHTGPITGLRWLADSQSILSLSQDQTVRVRRLSIQRVLPPLGSTVHDLTLLNNGAQFVTCGGTEPIAIRDLTNGQLIRNLEGFAGESYALAARADGQRLVVGGDKQLTLWNPANPQPLQQLTVTGKVTALAWSPDNLKLTVATDTPALYFFGPPLPPQNAQPGNELFEHQQLRLPAVASRLNFAPDNRTVWATHADGHLGQWAYAAPTPLRQMNHGGPVYAVAISRDGKTVVSGSTDQSVRIWDATTGQQRAQLSGHVGAVHSVCLSPDESLIVSSGADRTVRLWDAVGGKPLKQLAVLSETMYSVQMHPNGQIVAAGGADRQIHLLNLLTGTTERVLTGHKDYIHSVGFNATGTRLLSYSYSGDLRVWDPANGQQRFERSIGRIGNYANYDPLGKRVILSNGDTTARVVPLPAE